MTRASCVVGLGGALSLLGIAHCGGSVQHANQTEAGQPDASAEEGAPREGGVVDADGSAESPDADVWVPSSEAGMDASVGDSSFDSTAVDSSEASVPVLMLGQGLEGDGGCPPSLQWGFVPGTETCADLSSSSDASVSVCLPANDSGLQCPVVNDNLMMACNESTVVDGPYYNPFMEPGGGFYSPLRKAVGKLFCYDRSGWVEWRSPGLCCALQPANAFRHFAYGRVVDTDEDTIPDLWDNCPTVDNISQADSDGDGLGDVCDNCPYAYNPDQASMTDGGIGNACNCALMPAPPLGVDGCPCADAGAGATDASIDLCHLLVGADGGVGPGP